MTMRKTGRCLADEYGVGDWHFSDLPACPALAPLSGAKRTHQAENCIVPFYGCTP